MKINFAEGKHLIKEGDILLYRGTGIISRFIKSFTNGKYSHCAIASWHNGDYNPPLLECIEFREMFGGRTTSLEVQVNTYPDIIDVYRPNPYFYSLHLDSSHKVNEIEHKYNGKLVTDCMRRMTGLPYGYKRVWYIAKLKLAGIRMFYNYDDLFHDDVGEVIYPVCSTILAHCFNKFGFDVVKNKSDEYTEPSDFSRSTQLNYLFTLSP